MFIFVRHILKPLPNDNIFNGVCYEAQWSLTTTLTTYQNCNQNILYEFLKLMGNII